jgi:hypothetical protein
MYLYLFNCEERESGVRRVFTLYMYVYMFDVHRRKYLPINSP